MNDTRRFTVYLPPADIDEDHVVVARNLPGPDAIKMALELSGDWSVRLWEDEYKSFRLYRWQPHANKWPDDKRRLDTLCATVVKTANRARDQARGMSVIVDQFLRRTGHYGKGRIETEDEFDRRLLHVAKRREVHRLDKVIATKLVDALLADGYAITDVSYDEFERSTDRDAILAFLFEIDKIELIVEKNAKQSWIRLIFEESGWDLVQDHTVDLGYLIDPIVEPYLPWKRADATGPDSGAGISEASDDGLKMGKMPK